MPNLVPSNVAHILDPVHVQINTGNHKSPYSHIGYYAVPSKYVKHVKIALLAVSGIATNVPTSNAYFRGLKYKRSLTQILAAPNIWVNYSPTLPYYAQIRPFDVNAMEFNKDMAAEIGLSTAAYEGSLKKLVGALIHEFAHVAGAGRTTKEAETANVYSNQGSIEELITGIDDPRTPYAPWVEG